MSGSATAERVRIWRPAALDRVEVLHGSGIPRLWRMFHETYGVCLTSAGAGSTSRYRRWEYTNNPGNVALFEPGEVHADQRVHGSCRFQVVFLDASAVADAAEELGMRGTPPHLSVPCTRDPSLAADARRFHEAVDRAPHLEQASLLAVLIGRMLESCAERAARPVQVDRPAVRRARDYLHAHWAGEVSLDALARAAYTSKYHLVRSFVREVGVPPHQYQILLRLTRAKEMLRTGMAAGRVGLECGFTDHSYFTLRFRKSYGLTPSAYTRNVGGEGAIGECRATEPSTR